MRRFRFHLGTLVILVLLSGVGFAALRESNETWDSSIFSITIAALLISVLLAIHRRDSRRAFWIGFALFGWIYLGLTQIPSIESRLITSRGLAYLDSKVPRPTSAGFANINYTSAGFADIDYNKDGTMDLFVTNNWQPNVLNYVNKGNGTFEDVTPAWSTLWNSSIFLGAASSGSSSTTANFVRIGHSLVALFASLLGGLISRYLFAKNREPDSGPVNAQA